MNYHDFKQQIISTLSDRLGSDVRITVSDILKNNDTHLDGLTILAPGQNLAPTIIWITTMDSMSAADRFPTSQTTF